MTVEMVAEDVDVVALRAELAEYGQEHLLRFWDQLDTEQRHSLVSDIRAIDFADLKRVLSEATSNLENASKLDEKLKPLPEHARIHDDEAHTSTWRRHGLECVAKGKVAVLLLAGGQGTRLGTSKPKGMFDIDLPSHKSLYQLQAERVVRLQKLAAQECGTAVDRAVVPWYVMTSEKTKEETQAFFGSHDFFGLQEGNVLFFEQSTMPCVDFDGKVILETPSKVASAPDGNGGVYSALVRANLIADMEARGIEYVHVYCVDNCLVRMADPVFVGYCALKGVDAGNKVVPKAFPTEPVGVLCLCDDQYRVVEYSEITPETASRTNADGSLTFNAGNIANHFFSVSFLRDICANRLKSLPHHVAKKKIPHVTDDGTQVKPTTPNGMKMEKFVFDVFAFAASMGVLECAREEEFSPLKNAAGAEKFTALTARGDLMAHHRKVVEAAGGIIAHDDAKDGQFVCEISPLLSYAGENLEARVRGKTFTSPLILDA